MSEPAFAPGRNKERWSKAAADIAQGLARWQLWWLLALNDIRQRYRRSVIGQFWITFSMAAFIGAIGFVYSLLFKMEMREYLPHLAVNLVVWTFMAGTISDSCLAFTQSESYLRQERLPKTAFIMRVIVRNLLIFFHNVLIVPAVMLLFSLKPTWTMLLALPGLAIITINLVLGSFFLGVICARFRDMPQIVAAFIQIAFFASPVMWHRAQISASLPAVVELNPFAHHLALISEPLLGATPSAHHYIACLASTALLAGVAVPFFARYRDRVVYWL